MPVQTSPVWFVTGCSTGFGHELAKNLIARGWPTVITARDKSKLAALVKGHEETTLALDLDVTKQDEVEAAAKAVEQRFGRLDVLVNNAGYGYISSVEEGDEKEIRAQFDANVFGLFAITRAILPMMRKQKRGHIINITSVAGITGFPGSGYYSASKHAVEGWSDSLAAEMAPLGIKVTCVEPGPFRTDWAGRSMTQTPNKIADYADTVGARMKTMSGYSGKQPGDPVRAAEAMIKLVELEHPPRHLPLGAFAYEMVPKKVQSILDDVNQWRELGLKTDFPEQAA